MVPRSSSSVDILFVLFSGILFGTLAIFAAFLSITGVPALTQVTWRFGLAAPVILVASLLVSRKTSTHVAARQVWLYLLQGFVLSFATFGYVGSIASGTSASMAGFLGNMAPIFTMVLAKLFLKEGISLKKGATATLSILGAALLLLGNGAGWMALLGNGSYLALLSSVFFAAFILMNSRVSSVTGNQTLPIVFWTFVGATLSSFLFSVAFVLLPTVHTILGASLTLNYTVYQWELLAGFALISTALAYLFFTLGLRTVDGTSAAILLLSTPISTVIMGTIFLGEFLDMIQLLGGALIVIGIFLVSTTESKKPRPN